MAIPSAIRKVGAVNDTHIHLLLCAGPGFGKTVFFGTGGERVLFLTTDPEGTLSAAMLGSDSREWPVKEWDTLVEAYKYLRDGGIAEMGIDWVVIDNISEAQEQGKQTNIKIEKSRNPKVDDFVPSQANYQRTQNMLVSMVKQFNDLPVHVGYTAWIETHEDNEGVEYYAPAIHGQKGAIAQAIAGYMNVVGYGEVVEDEKGDEHRVIWFSQSGPNRGKDRYVALGRKRTDLTLPEMERLIQNAIKKRLSGASETTKSTRSASTATRRRTTATRKK